MHLYVHSHSLNQNAGAQELDKLYLVCVMLVLGLALLFSLLTWEGSMLPTETHRVMVTSVSRTVTFCIPIFHLIFPLIQLWGD